MKSKLEGTLQERELSRKVWFARHLSSEWNDDINVRGENIEFMEYYGQISKYG